LVNTRSTSGGTIYRRMRSFNRYIERRGRIKNARQDYDD
jgi:hypothetical protein